MKPYYQDEKAGIVIYHGDCREVLPQLPKGWCSSCACELADESILAIHLAGCAKVRPYWDAIVTDPPYGISLENHAAGRERRTETYRIEGDDSAAVGNFIIKASENAGFPIIIFASPWQPFSGKWRNLIAWDKGPAVGGGGDTGLCLKRSWELIQTARTRLNGSRDESVLRYWITPQDTEIHVARKPVELMSYLLAKLTAKEDAILDPCCGSGATLEAAKKLRQRAIGIEIEERYAEIAAKRLSQEVFNFG